MVIGKLPVGAVRATDRMKSDVPEGVKDVGLKVLLTPDGTPVADSTTAESKPPESITDTTA